MNNYRYTLEPYKGIKSRYRCSNCNKPNVFTRYIDTQTNEHLTDAVGRCAREIKCGYHYKPKQYFQDNSISFDTTKDTNYVKPKTKLATNYIDAEVMSKTITTKSDNNFIKFLISIWNFEVAYDLAKQYNIGTSNYFNGASTIFWQVDVNGRTRSGKIMKYNASNGKRIKEPHNLITWAHKALKYDSFNLKQCLFGEHLLNEDLNKSVAIVESEKTAIIASMFLPEFIWLAVGSVNNLNEAKTKVLKGRNVVLFPDAKCFDLWNDKIPQLTSLATFRTSTLIKDNATDEENNKGFDMADYLLKIER
jgi:hypothetical protein